MVRNISKLVALVLVAGLAGCASDEFNDLDQFMEAYLRWNRAEGAEAT